MQATISSTTGNRLNLARLEAFLADLLAETLRPGFHGKASFELAIQDGTIQQIRRIVERIER